MVDNKVVHLIFNKAHAAQRLPFNQVQNANGVPYDYGWGYPEAELTEDNKGNLYPVAWIPALKTMFTYTHVHPAKDGPIPTQVSGCTSSQARNVEKFFVIKNEKGKFFHQDKWSEWGCLPEAEV